MTAQAPAEPEPPPTSPSAPARPYAKLAGFLIGLALLAAAAWAVRSRSSELSGAWASMRSASPVMWLAVLALPVVNWLLSAEVFLVLTRRYAPVPRTDMHALIGSAWLLNFLPLRPGLFGRVAYHRRYHGVSVPQSAKVILHAILCGAVALTLLALSVLLVDVLGTFPLMGLLILAPGLVMASSFARGADGSPGARAFLAALGLKLIDSFAWSLRYLLAFQLAGTPISPTQAVAAAVVGQAAMLIPLAGNGLGVREWAVGALAASLPHWMAGANATTLETGLAAELINRAAEVAIALPVGLAGSLWIARAARQAARRAATPRPS